MTSPETWQFGHNETILIAISTPLREALDEWRTVNGDISRAEAVRLAISQLIGTPDPGRRRRYENPTARRAARQERRRRKKQRGE